MKTRILKFLVIITLIATLSLTDFVILGRAVAIAMWEELETQNVTTNVKNVEFDGYFEENGEIKHSKESRISEEETLILSIKVKEKGLLKDAKIKIENANFEIQKDEIENSYIKNINQETNEIELNQIIYQNSVKLEIPIKFKKQENFSEDYFEKENTITLTGTYQDEKETSVAGKINTRIIWKEETDVNLSQEIEKYIDLGAEGALLQQKIVSEVVNNQLPRNNEIINLQVPIIDNETPQSVCVLLNGKKLEEEKINYNQETKELVITNQTTGIWGTAKNEYKIIYKYNQIEFANKTISLYTKLTTKLYTQENKEKEDSQETVEIAAKGNIASISKAATESLYKGYLYAANGNETVYQEISKIEISEVNSVDSLTITKDQESFLNEAQESFDVSKNILYKSTKFSKDNLQEILGENWSVSIKNNADETIANINKDTQADENGVITINYETETNYIKIETSKPQSLGTLKIATTKAIKSNTGYTKEQLKTFVSLATKTKVATNLSQEIAEAKIVMQDTKTEAKVEISNSKLSTLQTNENINLLVTLKSDNEQYDLYNKPTVKIILPQELNLDVKNITQLNGEEQLKIVNSKTYRNSEGNQIISLEFEGEQTTFGNNVNEGIQISITSDITIDKTTPSKEAEIKMNYTNENRSKEEFTTVAKVLLVSKYGVLTVNKLSNYNAGQDIIENMDDKIKTAHLDIQSEAKEAKGEYTIVNNYENDITEISIIGKIPAVGEKQIGTETVKATFETELKEAITAEGKEARILYSEDENAEKESNTWSEQIQDITKVKAFKIELQDNKLASGEKFKINYNIQIPEMLQNNASTYETIDLYYNYAGDTTKANSTICLETEEVEEKGITLTQEEINEVTIELIGKTGGKILTQGQDVYEGQGIKYIVRITNNTEEEIQNIGIKATQTNAIFYTEKIYNDGWDSVTDTEGVEYSRLEEDPELEEKEIKIDSLKPGETVIKEYQFSVKEVEGENETTTGEIQITADGQETKTYNTFTNPIKQAELKLQIRDNYELEDKLITGGDYPFFFDVTNISGKTQQNIILKFEVPEGFTFKSNYLWEAINNEYRFISYENNILTVEILQLEVNEMLSIRLSLDIDEMDTDIESKSYDFLYTATLGENTYFSNERTQTIYNTASIITANQTGSIKGEEVEDGDKLDYMIEIENKGPRNKVIQINDMVPTGAEIRKVTMQIYEGENQISTEEKNEFIENNVSYTLQLEAGQKCIITIETKICFYKIFTQDITNEVKIITADKEIICNSITYKLKENPNSPSNPEIEATYNIQGVAWQDSNKNGLREVSEELLKDIEVVLIKEETGTIVTNENGNELITKTDENGAYKFENITKGTYLVAFKYDNIKYRVTQYQTQGVSQNSNSDVISKKIILNNKEENVAITGNLKIEKESLENIDAGFIQNEKFDLKLNKSISKIIVQNSKGTTVNQYNNAQLAKIELDSKKIDNSTVIIEYNIQVTNEGELAGYANEIIDYKPSDLSFSSEMNKNWYQSTDGQLHSKELANQSINPGETKVVALTLVKRMNQENTGTTINTAEIGQASNALSIADIDSTPANKIAGEDDMSTAEVVISIRTGGVMMYLSLIVIVTAIIGIGSYIIKKKVLTNDTDFIK